MYLESIENIYYTIVTSKLYVYTDIEIENIYNVTWIEHCSDAKHICIQQIKLRKNVFQFITLLFKKPILIKIQGVYSIHTYKIL